MTNKLLLAAGPHYTTEGGLPCPSAVEHSQVSCVFFSTAPIRLRLLSVSEWGLLLRAGWGLHLRVQVRILGEAL